MTAHCKNLQSRPTHFWISKNLMAFGYPLCLFKLSLQIYTWALLNSRWNHAGFSLHTFTQLASESNKCLSRDSHLPLHTITATGPRDSCAFINTTIAMGFTNPSYFRNLEKKPDHFMNKTGVQLPSHARQSSGCQSVKYFWLKIKKVKPLGCIAYLLSIDNMKFAAKS